MHVVNYIDDCELVLCPYVGKGFWEKVFSGNPYSRTKLRGLSNNS
jgi:hypothetical protein